MEQRAHTLLRLLPWCVAGPLPLGGHCIECAQRPLWKGLGRHAGQGPLSLISPLCSKIMSQHHPQTRRAGGAEQVNPWEGRPWGQGLHWGLTLPGTLSDKSAFPGTTEVVNRWSTGCLQVQVGFSFLFCACTLLQQNLN